MDQYKWNLENIKNGLEKFYKSNERYPTSHEVDQSPNLPSSRQIQRRFGGLVELRKVLNLSGPLDFTKGEYSSTRAKTINSRAHEKEMIIYKYLINIFGVPFVHREYFFTDDRRARTDFFVHCQNGNFSVDVFFPKDKYSLSVCLNSKMRTYGDDLMLQYPVIFLMLNDAISKEEVSRAVENKKYKLSSYQKVMGMAEFEKFCIDRIPFKIQQLN